MLDPIAPTPLPAAPIPIRRGFNRIGLFGLVPLCVLAVGCLGFAAITWVQAPRTDTTIVRVGSQAHELPGIVSHETVRFQFGGRDSYVYPEYPRQEALSNAQGLAGTGLLLFVLGGLWWAFWAGIGWIAAGFQREAKP